jgi:hypothetical protein
MWYERYPHLYELTHGSFAQLAACAGCLKVSLAFCFEQTEHQTSAAQRHYDDELSVEVVWSFLRRYRNLRDQHGNLAFFRISTCTGTRSSPSPICRTDHGPGKRQ